jgi:hypothetical protein
MRCHVREANSSHREAVHHLGKAQSSLLRKQNHHRDRRSPAPPPACHLERRNRVAIAQSKPKVLAPQGDRRAIGSTRSTLFAQILHERDKKPRVNTASVPLFSRAHHYHGIILSFPIVNYFSSGKKLLTKERFFDTMKRIKERNV